MVNIKKLRQASASILTMAIAFAGLSLVSIVQSGPAKGVATAWSQVSSGSQHTCAISAASVFCWGDNTYGQMGLGWAEGKENRSAVYKLNSVSSISSGATHTCALKSDKTVWCWGSNAYGQIGFGKERSYSAVPQQVLGITTATAVTSGKNHSCAIYISGREKRVACWGANGKGQIGQLRSTSLSTKPMRVGTIRNAESISAGAGHTCVLLATKSIICWGWNDKGQLGNGSNSDSVVPVTVVGITSATSVSSGFSHVCARLTDSKIRCWGWNVSGQLGDGTKTDRNKPVPVEGITTATRAGLSAGYYHNCAALSNGTLKCWGQDDNYKLGKPYTDDQTIPVLVAGFSSGKFVSGGGSHTCAIRLDNSLWCWGLNDRLQVTNSDSSVISVPTQIGN
jgi:alpha-tubulin suppressor-like RCC1 family protein